MTSCDDTTSTLHFLVRLRDLYCCCPAFDDKGRSPVSNAQLRRWLDQGAVKINGKMLPAAHTMPDEVTSLTFFSGKRLITVW